MRTFCSWCASKDLFILTSEAQVCRNCSTLYLNDCCTKILSCKELTYLLKHPKTVSKYRNIKFRTVVRASRLYRVSKIDENKFTLERDVQAKGGYIMVKEKVPTKLLLLNGITHVGQKVRYVSCMRVNKETGLIESVEYYKPVE